MPDLTGVGGVDEAEVAAFRVQFVFNRHSDGPRVAGVRVDGKQHLLAREDP